MNSAITLKQLHVFVEVARHGNVTVAAQTLYLTQPAVSMALAQLETLLNHQLFERARNRLVLNEKGRYLLPKAVEIIDRVHSAEQSLKTGIGTTSGSLRISASLTVGNYLMPGIVGRFLEKHPNVYVSLKIENTHAVIEDVLAFNIDVGFVEDYQQTPETEIIQWREDRLAIFASPKNPLTKQTTICESNLQSQPWILREHGSGTRHVFENAIAGRLKDLRVILELNQAEAVKQAVEDDMGISCMSILSIHKELVEGRLVELHTPFLDLRRHLYIVLHKKKYRSDALKAFLEFV
jgi:DNA-binding transcriptional LysR family regulator